ncbi:hypothetical protein NQ317_017931 [Molorchus minor]|uniref:glutaminase n=1 Tax=Molorchus minor TaxID=1323400 RepID=A0ABQ9JQS3_9CUCU|nr:hypothetical protein NQ317_017931 [Molorchus minor]
MTVPNKDKIEAAVQQFYDANFSQSGNDVQPEIALFEMFKNQETGLLSIGKFLSALKATGLRKNDPRLKDMMENIKQISRRNSEGHAIDTHKLNLEQFKSIVQPSINLLSTAFRHQFIIPEFQEFSKEIEDIYWKCKENTCGTVASYIPQLKRMSPNYWGISIVTIDGQRYSMGDVNIPFTIQSCSKPLSYAIALDLLGAEVVHRYVGQEPSGRNFNELILDHNKKPHNPMINAGAIIICSLLKTIHRPEMSSAEKFDFTMNYFEVERLAGGEDLGFNNACCSMEANCDIVAVMAATLANGGICPLLEEKVLKPESVRDVLSLMHSCGMYDYSGQFAFKVGLPAKSGVSGAMLVVVPNVMGIGKKFNFHRYDNLRHASDKSDPRKHKYETLGLNIVNLLFSAASGDLAGLRRHKLSGMDMTLSDYDGRTALHLATAEGHLDCVEFLLKACLVPYDVRDRWGRTPLEEALSFGHTTIMEMIQLWDEEATRNASKK